jgi:hypothetical protein
LTSTGLTAKPTTKYMPERGSNIDQREVLEHRQRRLDLPTEKDLLTFISERDGGTSWEGLHETWEREKERGVLSFFEKETARALKNNDDGGLETARAFIHYLDERFHRADNERQTLETIPPDKIQKIRDYVTTMINDYELSQEVFQEFDRELSDCNIHNACEPLLRRLEIFIDDSAKRIDEIKNAAKRDALCRLQVSARYVRNELLRRHFENPETH